MLLSLSVGADRNVNSLINQSDYCINEASSERRRSIEERLLN
jgi:hypothetical protein